MESSIVSRKFFSGGTPKLLRLDPEFAQPSLLMEEEYIKENFDVEQLFFYTDKKGKSFISSASKADDELVKYISIDSVDTADGFVYEEAIFFSDRPSRAKYLLKNEDILISNVRPNRGAITLISNRNIGSIGSSGFTLLRSMTTDISPLFLFAFLKTNYARNQLIRRNRGSMYPAVLPIDVFDICVPTPPKELHEIIVSRVQEVEKFHDIFFQERARQQDKLYGWLSAIASPPPSPLEDPSGKLSVSIRRRSDFIGESSKQRFDAEFFRQEYDTFHKELSAKAAIYPLGDCYRATNGRSLGKPVEEVPYVKQAALTNVGINWSAVEDQPGSTKPPRGRVYAGDILLACTAHEIYYVGRKVDYVRAVPSNIQKTNVAVADIMILRPKKTKPEKLHGSYVASFLQSPWGLHQVQRCIRGLRGGHVYGVDLEKYVKIPIPDDDWLDGFEKISESMEVTRNIAKERMLEIIDMVEIWIRKA